VLTNNTNQLKQPLQGSRPNVEARRDTGATTPVVAAEKGNVQALMMLLLDCNADVNAAKRTGNMTPLHAVLPTNETRLL